MEPFIEVCGKFLNSFTNTAVFYVKNNSPPKNFKVFPPKCVQFNS